MKDRRRARELAAQYIAKGDPTGWFDQLYREGEAGQSVVPWDDREPNQGLLDFFDRPLFDGLAPSAESLGKVALQVGCGLGDDAEHLAGRGFETTAFDVSESAIRICKSRFPGSSVRYVVADLLNPPQEWHRRFDFVYEAFTIQALPLDIRAAAIRAVAGFVKPGGRLLVIARAREDDEELSELPWPLSRRDFEEFSRAGLQTLTFEEYWDGEHPPARRFRALYALPPEV